MKITRCKFQCNSITKSKYWRQPAAGEPMKFLFQAKFHAVMDDSPENKKFFDATPSGQIEIGTYTDDVFEPGKLYYIDIHEVVPI
jgi:hypothetical protein